ncbi:MAG TPA: AAA family ATPase [Coleofasciculaceae cyanobacterium]|jgi:predicted ATPase/serine phosphatase RsbU (regulator of sigma subunit)/tRNA A-37 threonylcarbamoyl transferase component Bud32
MVMVAGYEVIAKLHESSRSLVYRGQRSDRQSSILKVMQAEYPSLEELGRYRLEYEIINRLNLEGIAQAYGLEPYQNGLVLILEDFGGQSLHHLLQARRLQLQEFLEMAIAISEVLSQVHAASIIHKDINPANIVLNDDLSQIKLIDFGNATVLSRENPTLRNPNVLEGTLAYLSPEQTGRMNRSLDYRTDFYSLGATFYEVLTGHPPFNVTDAMELIHCHLARQPELPHIINTDIPEIVSQIILKLLAKNAEDRYQSAYGIKVDLQHCLEQLRTQGSIAPFALAQNDASGRFQIPQKLYGRAAEVKSLMAGFERVAGEQRRAAASIPGSSELMLVSGYSGIGKSALVQEVYKPITRRNGYFIAGKFDQFQRNVPYSALIQVFQELMRQLLTESPERIDRWRLGLLDALGMNGQVVIDVIPEVELIIGEQSAVPELEPKETQNRFNLVFQNFIKVFTQAEHPLVIFLDDLQWADLASLKLIQLLMTAPDSRYLFLVAAYRSNEVSAVHPLSVTLEEIRKAGGTMSQIELSPLTLDTVQQVIAETFNCDRAKAAPLSELVMQITDGNPFFMSEFLKSLYENGLLNFDGQLGGWQWDLNQIREAHIPDNVVELMAGKIQKLSPNSQQMLKLAACIGNQFDAKTLAIVSEKSQAAIAADLWQSVQEGLILPLADSYKFTGIDQQQVEDRVVSFKFLHDRVQQAAYSLIPEAETKTIHRTIGRSLLAHITPEEREEKIFDIVNQLNMGIGLMTQQAQRDELAALNLTAGIKAKDSTAYETALRYFLTGIGLLDADSWQTQYERTLALHEAAAEAAYLNGDFEETERLVERILHHAKTLLDRVNAYHVRIHAYSAQNNMEAALDIFVTALGRLGEPIPRRPSRLRVGLELIRTRYWVIGNRPIAKLEALPPMTDPYKLAVIQLTSSVVMASVNVEPLFVAVLALRIVNMIVRYGSSPLSAVQGIAYGVMLRVGLGETEGAYEFGQLSLRLIDRFNARLYRTFTLLGFESCIRHWKEPLRRSLPELLGAYTEGLELGNLEPAGLAASVYCFHQFFLGEPLAKVAEAYQQYITLLVRFKQEMTVYSMQPWHQLVLNLQGLAIDPSRLVGTAFDEEELLPLFMANKLGIPLYYTYIAKAIWLYHLEDYSGSLQAAELAQPHQESSPVTTPYANQNFYHSLACLALCSTVPQATRKAYLRQVAKKQRQTQRWAKKCPENYQHRHDLVEAERMRVLGKPAEALDYYDRAIQAAKEQDYINEVALANELAAKFCLSIGREKFAQAYLLEARHSYLRWGATFKVEALDARYPQLRSRISERSSLEPRAIQTITTTSNRSSSGKEFDLDLDTVFKASQAISGEIVLDKLLAKLLKLVLENAGAQKGYLLLSSQDEWRIEAEGRIETEESILLQSRPLEPQDLPVSIINYVQRTREDLVLRDAALEGLFITDPYIIQTQPRSILCSPILNQGNLTGILYLENNLTTDAFTPERLTVLSILSAQAAIALENALFYRTLEQKVEERTGQLAQANQEITLLNHRLQSENLRMGAELALTRQIQQMILPKDYELSQIPNLEISGFMEPADEVGGDYYDVLQKDGHVKIGIGDVTGHGLESGVLMIMVQTAVRALLQTNERNPQVFLDQINRTIYDNVQRMDSDKNLTLALLDYRDGCLSLSGQHEELIVVRNGIVEQIETIDLGFPIGLEPEIAQFVNQVQIQLNPGDVVVLYTDGITEAENDLRQQYGLERLCKVVSQNWQRSTPEIREAVINDVRYHIGGHKIYDDMTLLILKQK